MLNESETLLGLFNAESFQSIQIELAIMNSATRTHFRSQPPSQIIEMTDQGFVLQVPDRSCAANQSLLITAKAIAPNKTSVRLEVTAHVDEIANGGDGTDRVSLSFLQIDESEWKNFQNLFHARQDEVTRFLAAARGYE